MAAILQQDTTPPPTDTTALVDTLESGAAPVAESLRAVADSLAALVDTLAAAGEPLAASVPPLAYACAAALGVAVGMTELVSRYRDDPRAAVLSTPGLTYLTINGLASVAALAVMENAGWVPAGVGADGASPGALTVLVLTAGFGAMAIFRSSLVRVRLDEEEVDVGPNSVIKVMMQATDRAVDRNQARNRAKDVTDVMKDVPFERALEALPPFAVGLMQNLSAEEQESLGRELAAIEQATTTDQVRSFLLGLSLMNVVGQGVLKASVEAIDFDRPDRADGDPDGDGPPPPPSADPAPSSPPRSEGPPPLSREGRDAGGGSDDGA